MKPEVVTNLEVNHKYQEERENEEELTTFRQNSAVAEVVERQNSRESMSAPIICIAMSAE